MILDQIHRKQGGGSDGTTTSIVAQTLSKCRTLLKASKYPSNPMVIVAPSEAILTVKIPPLPTPATRSRLAELTGPVS